VAAIVLADAPNHDGHNRCENLCDFRRFLGNAIFAEGIAFHSQARAAGLFRGILNSSRVIEISD